MSVPRSRRTEQEVCDACFKSSTPSWPTPGISRSITYCGMLFPQGFVLSGVRRLVEAARAPGENLAAILGDADRMLELGGERAVAGDRGPAVVEQFHVGAADVDHRLNGEEHAGFQFGAGAGTA